MDAKTYKLSEIADALDVPIARVRTMRARNQSGMWDSGLAEGEEAGRGWREYDITDAVALACVLDLVDRGLSSDIAASIVANCRFHIYDGPHPRTASRADIFIGVLHFVEGTAHVGGPLCDVLLEIDQRVRSDIRAAPTGAGGGSGLILINASRHHRRLKEKLAHGD